MRNFGVLLQHSVMNAPSSSRVALGGLALAFVLWAAGLDGEHAKVMAADRPPHLGVGATFEKLQVGENTTYYQVEVRSVNVRSVMIAHAKGLAAVRLRDLSPDLQAAFGYDPAAEAAADTALRNESTATQKRVHEQANTKRSDMARAADDGRLDQLLQTFGKEPELRPSVDLRPAFFQLALNVKDQGPRPSCAIFAIVSALEYQNAMLTGRAERFSEAYLLWATCRTLNRAPRARPDDSAAAAGPDSVDSLDVVDEGFALSEVVTALRAYGIPPQESLPYSFAREAAFKDPPKDVMEQARNRRRVSVLALPGHDQSTILANLIHALHANMPVAVGMHWPAARAIRGNYLNAQKPREGSGHAVTIVGYENKTGAIADTVFIFKNSWGVKWGAAGYGMVSYRYLFNNLTETALLEVGMGHDASFTQK